MSEIQPWLILILTISGIWALLILGKIADTVSRMESKLKSLSFIEKSCDEIRESLR